jgi:hypothetical protein
VLCALARVNSPIRVFQLNETFVQAAKILNDNNAKKSELATNDPARLSRAPTSRAQITQKEIEW